MLKKLIKCILALSICCLQSVGVMAAVPTVIQEDNEITISYNTGPNKTLSIFVYTPDYVLPDEYYNETESGGNLMDFIYQIAECTADEEGFMTYKFCFDDTASSGFYTISVEGTDENIQVLFLNDEKKQEILKDISAFDNADEAEDLNTYIQHNIVFLNSMGFKTDEYTAFESDVNRLNICRNIIEEDCLNDEIITYMNLYLVCEMINISSTAEEICTVIENYNNILGIDLENKYFKAYPKETYEFLYDALPVDLNTFKQTFRTSTAMANINEVTWGYIISILEEYNDIFVDIDIGGYNSLSSEKKTSLCMEMQKKEFSKPEEVVSEFNDLIDKYKNQTNNNNNSGGSGSGGGGSYGGHSSGSSIAVNPEKIPSILESGENEPIVEQLPFTDLDNYEWGIESVKGLYEAGVISKAEHFRPGDDITREECIKMLVVAFDLPITEKESAFADVNKDNWAYEYVTRAWACGITNGIDGENFGYGKSITRQEAATLINRILKYKNYQMEDVQDSVEFSDSDKIALWAEEAVNTMCRYGIINGFEDGTFRPIENCTRIQISSMVWMALKN